MEAFFNLMEIGIANKLFGTPYQAPETTVIIYNTHPAIIIASLILVFLVGYFLGSINFATFISKKKYKDDIREHGSGNAGMTNMMRTYGTKAAALTLLGDFLKTFVAVMVGYLLVGTDGAYIAGFGAVIGHTFPIYYKFKGGKGVVTAITMILCTNPLVGLILLIIFVLIVLATKYISLGSVMGALLYPIILTSFGSFTDAIPALNSPAKLISCFAIVALLVFNHRSNIKRLYEGKENKFSFKKSKKTKED